MIRISWSSGHPWWSRHLDDQDILMIRTPWWSGWLDNQDTLIILRIGESWSSGHLDDQETIGQSQGVHITLVSIPWLVICFAATKHGGRTQSGKRTARQELKGSQEANWRWEKNKKQRGQLYWVYLDNFFLILGIGVSVCNWTVIKELKWLAVFKYFLFIYHLSPSTVFYITAFV